MIYPSILLAFLAAVLGSPTSSALGELPCEFLPFAALVVCALSDPAPCVVLSTEIPHHDACPVLHVLRVVDDSELFNKRENVEVVGLEIFLHELLICDRLAAGQVSVKHGQLGR